MHHLRSVDSGTLFHTTPPPKPGNVSSQHVSRMIGRVVVQRFPAASDGGVKQSPRAVGISPGSHSRNFRKGFFYRYFKRITFSSTMSLRAIAAVCTVILFLWIAFKLSEARLVYQQYASHALFFHTHQNTVSSLFLLPKNVGLESFATQVFRIRLQKGRWRMPHNVYCFER
jgi:hypothetical protein